MLPDSHNAHVAPLYFIHTFDVELYAVLLQMAKSVKWLKEHVFLVSVPSSVHFLAVVS